MIEEVFSFQYVMLVTGSDLTMKNRQNKENVKSTWHKLVLTYISTEEH